MKQSKLMACMLCMGILLSAAPASSMLYAGKMSGEDVVSKVYEAMGGKEKVKAVKTLKLLTLYGGHKTTVKVEMMRPNKIRTESTATVFFNGKGGAFLKLPPAKDGSKRPPRLIGAAELPEFEVDVAFLFPAFFDFPYSYLGTEKVNGKMTHKLEVVLPLGARMTYFIDAISFLVTRTLAVVKMGDETHKIERIYKDYKEVSGIKYYHGFSFSFDGGKMYTAVNTKVEVNVPIPGDRFEIPDFLKEKK